MSTPLESSYEKYVGSEDKTRPAYNGDEPEPIAFLRAAAYTGLQSPLNGAVQLVNPEALPAVHFVDAPSDWRSLGALTGSLSATLGHAYLMMAAGNKIAGPAANGDLLALGKRALATGAVGGVYGFALTPVSNRETQNVWLSRAENAAAGAVGMAGISAYHTLYHGWISGGNAAAAGLARPDGNLLLRGMGVVGMPAIGMMADKFSSTGNDSWSGGSVFTPSQRLLPDYLLKKERK